MKLSMWILYDYLLEFHPTAYITSGKPELRNVRILSDDVFSSCNNVYLARAGNYIDSESNKVICVHEQDMILLETEDIEMVFNRILDCFDFYNLWYDSCSDLIKEGGTLQTLMEKAKEVFPCSMYIVDNSHTLLAYFSGKYPSSEKLTEQQINEIAFEKKSEKEGSIPYEMICHVRENRALFLKNYHCYEAAIEGELGMLIYNLFRKDTLWGWILLNNLSHKYSNGMTQVFDEFCHLMERWINYEEEPIKAMTDFNSLLSGLLEERDELLEMQLDEKLLNIGWQKNCPKSILMIEQDKKDQAILANICRRIAGRPGILTGIMGSYAVLILNMELCQFDELRKKLEGYMRSARCRGAISYEFTELSQLADQRKIAETALQYGTRENGCFISGSEYLLVYLMNTLSEHVGMNITHPALLILKRYDAVNKTELVETLYQYLRYEENYLKTAQVMYLHRNTVQYRIEKIVELTGIDLEDFDTRFHLLLSFLVGLH